MLLIDQLELTTSNPEKNHIIYIQTRKIRHLGNPNNRITSSGKTPKIPITTYLLGTKYMLRVQWVLMLFLNIPT